MRKTLKTIATAAMALALTVTAIPNIGSAAESSKEAIEAGKATFDPSGNTEYHAYLMFQVDQSWVFRDSFTNTETGSSNANFDKVLTAKDVEEAQPVDGEVTDTIIKGNGTYTVKVEGLNGVAATDPTGKLKVLGVSTDIPSSSNLQITDIKTKIDGMTKLEQPTAIFDDEEDQRSKTMTILVNNLYRNTEELGTELQVPNDSLEITFTVAGFDVDNPDAVEETPAPANTESDSADDSSESSSSISTPVVVGIVVVVVVVIGAVIIVSTRKKKK